MKYLLVVALIVGGLLMSSVSAEASSKKCTTLTHTVKGTVTITLMHKYSSEYIVANAPVWSQTQLLLFRGKNGTFNPYDSVGIGMNPEAWYRNIPSAIFHFTKPTRKGDKLRIHSDQKGIAVVLCR